VLDANDLKSQIEAALPGAEVSLSDTTGTGDHFKARVIFTGFAGKTMVEQHQMVYAPLRPLLHTGELHALALETYTPEQWAKRNGTQ
jgi:acid stress-induced BolA-like protein IbaG/YrbA